MATSSSLTRTTDSGVNADDRDVTGNGKISVSDDLQSRVDFANENQADVFVSIHFNAGPASDKGTEVFYNADRPFSQESKQLATDIYNRLTAACYEFGYDSGGRGVKKDEQATGGDPFYLLGPTGGNIVRESRMPTALGEALFITNPTEESLVENEAFLKRLGQAYADAVRDYLEGNG